ncbi:MULTISPECIES: VOC family protein [unclassified Serratia (in: enterobacteria)]|uniref:VOC family protein n=1 Tax=unclassified Serratia (in: enterobacteria) TaxID=2647522 RepID=UPI00050872C5|nr:MULTISPECIES: VOC family protein [unclassified Serratia (in: enterobacteria)]KFK96463.1 glyoxalase [Serratia sp. Ag2]KFK99938.1 glyoxalase [Serratia sp. Ag1]
MDLTNAILRIARPTDRLHEIAQMYCHGLGFKRLGEFEYHQGFDGIMLGHPQHTYHLEFTHHRGVRVGQAPTQDNLLVFYLPALEQWQSMCAQMLAAGFRRVPAYNPYWEVNGQTFEDLDGYRVVLQQGTWHM